MSKFSSESGFSRALCPYICMTASTHMDTAMSFTFRFPSKWLGQFDFRLCLYSYWQFTKLLEIWRMYNLWPRPLSGPIFTARGSGASNVENIVDVRLYSSTYRFLCYQTFRWRAWALEDDDLELLEENTGASFKKSRLTQLHCGRASLNRLLLCQLPNAEQSLNYPTKT